MATNQGQKFGDLVSELQGHKSWLGVMPICWYTDIAIGMFTVYCLVLETCTSFTPDAFKPAFTHF